MDKLNKLLQLKNSVNDFFNNGQNFNLRENTSEEISNSKELSVDKNQKKDDSIIMNLIKPDTHQEEDTLQEPESIKQQIQQTKEEVYQPQPQPENKTLQENHQLIRPQPKLHLFEKIEHHNQVSELSEFEEEIEPELKKQQYLQKKHHIKLQKSENISIHQLSKGALLKEKLKKQKSKSNKIIANQQNIERESSSGDSEKDKNEEKPKKRTELQRLKKYVQKHNLLQLFVKLENNPPERIYELSLCGSNLVGIQKMNLFKNLTKLDFSGNKISVIENLDFNRKLVQLNLMHNEIKVINNLHGMDRLQILYIHHNLLKIDSAEYLLEHGFEKKLKKLSISFSYEQKSDNSRCFEKLISKKWIKLEYFRYYKNQVTETCKAMMNKFGQDNKIMVSHIE